MSTEPTYKTQLAELYKTYTGKELEQAIGVSVRSIQNYLKSEDATTPSREVIGKIREAFTKHQNEGHIAMKNPDQTDLDLQTKYITLLENSLKEKSDLVQRIEKIDTSLNQMPDSMSLLTDLILKGQEAAVHKLHEELSRKLEKMEKMIASIASSATHKKPLQKDKH